MGPTQWAAVVVIVAAVYGVVRGADVRVVLFAAAAVLATLANDPSLVVREFFATFSNDKFVVPICSAMGFAYVLRHTGCDQHLVRALTAPVRRLRAVVIPGVVLVAFVVNVPVISQTSTAVCVGPVVVPLLRAAGYRGGVIAACLALGASVGGELLNPGAPELLTVSKLTHVETKQLAWQYLAPLLVPYVTVAVLAFWGQTVIEERRAARVSGLLKSEEQNQQPADAGRSPVNPLKAAVPLVPLALLFLTGPPLNIYHVPTEWIADDPKLVGTRLIGIAMLIGAIIAAAVSPSKAKECGKQFFDGAGYGFATIVSLIVTANCFGKGIEAVGLAKVLQGLIAENPGSLVPLAAAVPGGFAAVSGSGMASTQSLFGFFYTPAVELGHDPAQVGAMVSVASAAGRTASPVSAVVLMCASLAGVSPMQIVKRVAGPLTLGVVAGVVWQLVR